MSFEFPIERGQVRDFLRAAKCEDPAYDEPDAVVPPTFLAVATRKWATPGQLAGSTLDFEPRRILHGEEEFVFHGPPPRIGTVLTATSSIGDRYEKQGKRGGTMRFAVLKTEFHDPEGRLVAEQRTTLIETAPRKVERS